MSRSFLFALSVGAAGCASAAEGPERSAGATGDGDGAGTAGDDGCDANHECPDDGAQSDDGDDASDDGDNRPGDGSDGDDGDPSGDGGPECQDGSQNNSETDVDCGGPDCGPCSDGDACLADEDCESGHCVGKQCQAEPAVPLPEADYFVNGDTGSDDNAGTSKAEAFATIQRGIDAAGAGDIVEVASGIYFEAVAINNKGTSVDAPLWLRAEEAGGVVLSGAIAGARLGTASWTNEGGGTWSIPHDDDIWGGYHVEGETFLTRFKTRGDLESVNIDLQDAGQSVNTPTYGVAHQNGRAYVRLPGGADPNGEQIVLPRAWHVQMLEVNNSPYVHVDGFWFEAGGDQSGSEAAVTFDGGSQNGSIMNCVSTLQRAMARVPSNFEVRWCEHFYPGFKEVADAFRSANGNPNTVNHIWDYVKNYNRNPGTGTGGNAYYEGSIYRASSGEAPTNVHGDHLYVHEVFDGVLLGEFEDSSVSASVFDYIYDDCMELENNQTNSDGSGLEVYENLFLNASVIWLSRRSPISGPSYVYRNVLMPNDAPHGRGPHMIKTGGTADMYVYFNTLVKLDGMDHGTAFLGWGGTDAVTWNNDVDDIVLRNNAIIFEDGQQGTQPGLGGGTDYNLLYSDADDGGVRGGNGVFVGLGEGVDAIGFADYGTDFTPEGSALLGNAGPIPDGWGAPDNGWGTDDIGCFQASDPQPEDWPRRHDRSDAYGLTSKHFENPRVPPKGWR